MKLRNKLVFLFCFITILPILIVSYISFDLNRESLVKNEFHALTATIESRKSAFEILLELRIQQIEMLASNSSLKRILYEMKERDEGKKIDEYTLDKNIKDFLSQELREWRDIATYYHFVIVDHKGIVQISNYSELIGLNLGEDPRFRNGLKKTFHTKVFLDSNTNESAMSTVAPIKGVNSYSKPLGVLIATMGTTVINRIMANRKGLGNTGESLLGQQNGDSVYFINDLRHIKISPIIPLGSELAIPEQEAVQGRNGHGLSRDYRGVEIAAVWRHVENTDWGLVTKMDADEALAAIVILRNRIILWAIILIAFSSLLALIISRKLTSDIVSISDSFLQMSLGQPVSELKVNRSDEIGLLANSFNELNETNRLITSIAQKLGEGKYNIEIQPRSHEDALMIAMKRTAESLKERENKIKSSEGKLDSIFNNSFNFIALISVDGTILEVNDRALNLTQLTRPQIIGTKLWNSPIWTMKKESIDNIKKAVKNTSAGRVNRFYADMVNQDDRQITMDISMVAIKNDDNSVRNIVMEGRDLSETKELESRFNDLNQLNNELETFSYTVSHDLKAPLRAIQGFSGNLSSKYAEKIDERGKRWIEFIRRNAERMDHLISDILSFSKIGRKEVKREKVNMNDLVNNIVKKETTRCLKPVDFKSENLPSTYGDEVLLELVWQNLIENAFKYSMNNDVVYIRIKGEKKEGENIYSIEDKGAGFDMKHIDNLFGVFQRLHGTEEFEGNGVGLASVKRIIEKHNGKISAIGKINLGAKFTFTLPDIN